MKIQGRKNPIVTSLGPLPMPAAPEAAPAVEQVPAAADSVDLTSTQRLRALNQAAQSIPDVRLEKVEGLRGAIDKGDYHVESEKLAHKVVDDILTEALLEQGRLQQGL